MTATSKKWAAAHLSLRHDWVTPQSLFSELHNEFNFVLDAAASDHNAKCQHFLTDALSADWQACAARAALLPSTQMPLLRALIPPAHAVWLNPPYGRDIYKWIDKAHQESLRGVCVVVLVFSRTDTKWWHDLAMNAAEIRFIVGRITFVGAPAPAPAPSCLLVFDQKRRARLSAPLISSVTLPRKD